MIPSRPAFSNSIFKVVQIDFLSGRLRDDYNLLLVLF